MIVRVLAAIIVAVGAWVAWRIMEGGILGLGGDVIRAVIGF